MENTIAYRAYNLINQQRARYGKPYLNWEPSLYHLSLEHSYNLSTGRAQGHDGINSRTQRIPFDWVGTAENVAYNYGYEDPAYHAVYQWMTSPGHFKNLMGDYNVSGLACVKSRNGSYHFTQIFAKR